jgi:CRISPR-associated helicase Cas3
MHEGRRLSTPGVGAADELHLPAADALPESLYDHAIAHHAATMLDVRMLFSALVDADFIETEAHFDAKSGTRQYRDRSPALEPSHALDVLLTYIEKVAQESQAATGVNSLRADLLNACLECASGPQGRFTLTAPTGSGKTLSMLAFALKHAAQHNLRRVVMVIPYLNIIDQTARVYREILKPVFGDGYVLEHHSLAGTHGDDDGAAGVGESQRLQAENWDAPVIVTTSVQFLESLFSNRPSACRKLHRLAQSVILFDEVQTLPTGLAIPTLATLSRLVERYQATVVFATATQPAFSHLHDKVKEYCACGWQPEEIVPAALRLFDRARRTKVFWPEPEHRTRWDELAGSLASDDCRQSLCIVNLKRHALELFQKLRDRKVDEDSLFHLSTNMCPAHRRVVLDEVRQRLNDGLPCRLVSTQCVEAGVDVDFPVVYRAWGPFDSIAQAAGRCNRNGLLGSGEVRVFVPDDERYPPGAYEQAAAVTRVIAGTRALDFDDPAMFLEYFRQLYGIARPEDRNPELADAILRKDFADVARLYRVIEQDAVNVLVPYQPVEFKKLAEGARGYVGLTRDWILRARPYAVSLYRPKRGAPIRDRIVPLPAGRGEESDDWFEYVGDAKDYDPKTGLIVAGPIERLLIA